MSDPTSGSDGDKDGDKKGDGSAKSDGLMDHESDDFDQAKLKEKDAKRVLNDEVNILFFNYFLLNCIL